MSTPKRAVQLSRAAILADGEKEKKTLLRDLIVERAGVGKWVEKGVPRVDLFSGALRMC